jgi:trimeric autotransporter adhesin
VRVVAIVLISIALYRVGNAAQIERRFMETVDACGNLTGLKQPQGIAVDHGGRTYVSDTGNNRVLRITPPCQVDRLPLVLEAPVGLATDAAGNVYVTEHGRHSVWKIDVKGDAARFAGTGHRGFAGDGAAATAARLSGPTGVAVASDGTVFIADRGNNRVRAVSTSGVISTVVGTGKAGHALDESHRVGDRGPATRATLNKPTGVAIDRENNLFVTDQGNWRIRRIAADGRIDTLSVLQRHLTGIAVNADGNVLYTDKNTIGLLMRNPPVVFLGPRWNLNTPVSAIAPSTVPLPTSSVSGWGAALYAGAGRAGRDGEHTEPVYTLFDQPHGIAVDHQGLVLIADTNNNRIRRVARCSPPPAIVPRHCD